MAKLRPGVPRPVGLCCDVVHHTHWTTFFHVVKPFEPTVARNAQRVSRKINKVLQKDVEEAEADGRSQRLEIATAIRPAKSGEMVTTARLGTVSG